ncbi:MAG: bifunctional hydroxymethylpyrimidine kinase/phosphomethylpyrimidine kinase [Nitrososphaeria archaeon]|nr:bifunctional hydroxymethylpyrimidine kinase/phosphomethylpyrimidine kinase [Nitrososphaeria archaeon]
MKILVVGTVPIENFNFYIGTPSFDGDSLNFGGQKLPIGMGTLSLFSAAYLTVLHLKDEPPSLMTAGDIGKADGSRILYQKLTEEIERLKPKVLVLHYIMPILAQTKVFATKLKNLNSKPTIIADAGFMYAFKASKMGNVCDIFTPDVGEMAFLADEEAVHPAYMEKHLFEIDSVNVEVLIEQARKVHGLPKMLIVKGAVDYIVYNGNILFKIDEPMVPFLEPIGGTGDTLAGILSGLIAHGLPLEKAAYCACKINRVAGLLTNPTPRTRVNKIISNIPKAIDMVLSNF